MTLWVNPVFSEEKVIPNSAAYILDHPNLSRKVSLALNDTNIVDALVYLSEKAEVNIAVSRTVEGRATLSLNDVSIRDALDIILLSNGLALEKRGNIFYVMPASDYETQHGERWSEIRQARIFKLDHARPADVQSVLTAIQSRVGSIVIDNETGTLVAMDTPEKIKQMDETIKSLDHAAITKAIDLKYANAADVQAFLAPRLDARGVGSIQADARYNRVIVTALPNRMEETEKVIRDLDAKIRQVLIEAKIVRVRLTPDLEYGVDWERFLKRESISIDSHFPVNSALTSIGKVVIGKLGPMNIDATLKLLRTIGEAKLLSSPRISALNNEEARIFVGTREVYTTSTTTTSSGDATTATTVNFIDVGISLRVTPVINEDGFVLMRIRPEVSRIDHTVTTSDGNEIPVVDTTSAETRVMVKDGNTIIIGGLIKDETTRDTQQIPVLGSIPYIGTLFKHVREEKEKSELVVFLTPHIIGQDENMTDFDKKKLKPMKGYDENA